MTEADMLERAATNAAAAIEASEARRTPERDALRAKAHTAMLCRLARLCIVDGVETTTKKSNYLVSEVIGTCTCGVCHEVITVT